MDHREEDYTQWDDEVPSLDGMEFSNVEEAITTGYRRIAGAESGGQYYLIKGLRDDLVDDFDYLELLSAEYEYLRNLHTPYTPVVKGLMSDGPIGPCLVVEGVHGQMLSYYMKQLRSSSIRKTIALRIVEAMAEVHSHGYSHGDLRPANIYVSPVDLVPWIGGFALPESEAYYRYFNGRGKDDFVPPEYTESEIVPTPQADVYSMGQLLRYLNLDKEYKNVIKRAVNPDPSRRYSNAAEMFAAMRRKGNTTKTRAWILIILLLIVIGIVIALAEMRKPLPSYNSAAEKVPIENQ